MRAALQSLHQRMNQHKHTHASATNAHIKSTLAVFNNNILRMKQEQQLTVSRSLVGDKNTSHDAHQTKYKNQVCVLDLLV